MCSCQSGGPTPDLDECGDYPPTPLPCIGDFWPGLRCDEHENQIEHITHIPSRSDCQAICQNHEGCEFFSHAWTTRATMGSAGSTTTVTDWLTMSARTAWCAQGGSADASVDPSSQILTTAVRDRLRLVLENEHKTKIPRETTHIKLILRPKMPLTNHNPMKVVLKKGCQTRTSYFPVVTVFLWCPCFLVSITNIPEHILDHFCQPVIYEA